METVSREMERLLMTPFEPWTKLCQKSHAWWLSVPSFLQFPQPSSKMAFSKFTVTPSHNLLSVFIPCLTSQAKLRLQLRFSTAPPTAPPFVSPASTPPTLSLGPGQGLSPIPSPPTSPPSFVLTQLLAPTQATLSVRSQVLPSFPQVQPSNSHNSLEGPDMSTLILQTPCT